MSDRMTAPPTIGALDLAALLCSRLCHDLISPVGAIINGLEVMEEDKDEETKTFALDLIKKSAGQASAKLQFCRLAFGASGSAGAQIELGDAEKAAAVYRGIDAMTAEDVADCVLFALTRPWHVNVDEIVVKARNQSSGARILRDE